MRRIMLVLWIASGCSPSGENVSKKDLEGEASSESSCCKIEGSEIGRDDHLVRLGSRSVLVHDWVPKAGEANEFVGFSITIGGGDSVTYKVKASGEVYTSSDTVWMHPNGVNGGSQSPGISNVDFCGNCDNPDGCSGGDGGGGDGGGGGGGGDGGTCDNPDGCDTGGGTGGGGPLY